MKLVSYAVGDGNSGIGLVTPGGQIVDMARALEWATPGEGPGVGGVPASMIALLAAGPEWMARARSVAERLVALDEITLHDLALPADARLLAPVPRPNNLRDFYAFEQHVRAARRLRGLDMIPEWYEIPVFYFSNPDAVYGPDEPVPVPKGTAELDYELEIACVIGQAGRDIPAEEADAYIAG